MKIARITTAAVFPCALAFALSGCASTPQAAALPSIQSPAVQVDAGQKRFVDLHNFRTTDGSVFSSGVIQQSGKLYGVASHGGSGSSGVVYEATLDGKLRILYTFPAQGPDAFPDGHLLAYGGKFYGTTANAHGSVYSLTPSGSFSLIHAFHGQDGDTPQGGLIEVHRTLYGVTTSGGTYGDGVVFAVDSAGNVRTVYNFGGVSNDGTTPASHLTWWNGKLYGTTESGGTNGSGTVYSLTLAGAESVIYNFGSGSDGKNPFASPVTPHNGKLYGTTEQGGAYGNGTVFAIDASGAGGTLYSFGQQSSDGQDPAFGLIVYRGALYGTAPDGGRSTDGTIFRVTASGRERTVYDFRGLDGKGPMASPVAAGNQLYGTATSGGRFGDGTLYRFTP